MAAKGPAGAAATTRAVFRSAEDLYSQLPVRDVVRVLAKTKEDAEKKREELRDLVGRRYHDLIDSADAIISMNDTVLGFEKLLLNIESSAGALLAESQQKASTSKLHKAKRKQEDLDSTSHGATEMKAHAETEEEQIEQVMRAPTEIWSAIDAGDELKAAKLYLNAIGIGKRLGINRSADSSVSSSYDETSLEEACRELGLTQNGLKTCKELAVKVSQERAMAGEWLLNFPFLISQYHQLGQCRKDIVGSASSAFVERQISPQRVEQALEALLLVGEISDPLASLLAARSQGLTALLDSSASLDNLFAVAELAAKTVKDSAWLQSRFRAQVQPVDINNWLVTIVAPVARQVGNAVCAQTGTIGNLASLQRAVKDIIRRAESDASYHKTSDQIDEQSDETLFKTLFQAAFTDRSTALLNASFESILRKVKRVLNQCGNAADQRRNEAAYQAFGILQKGLENIEKDAAELLLGESANGHSLVEPRSLAWLADLVSWLEQRPTLAVARFCELLLRHLNEKQKPTTKEYRERLNKLEKQALQNWAEQTVATISTEFEAAIESFPWEKRDVSDQEAASLSPVMGGWTPDETHGDLPSVPSFPVAEACFRLARELDAVTSVNKGTECGPSDAELHKLTGDLLWRRMHTVYSTRAKDAQAPHGKLQAAFDLEYACAALLQATRPPASFTSGGVDVYACQDVLRKRAQSYAQASRHLHPRQRPVSEQAVHETKVGAHALLTVIEPVPRFALLPVPQKRAHTPGLIKRSSSQYSADAVPDEYVASKPAAPARTGATGGFGRVLGWLT